jgi:hypothetical protein
METRLLQQYRQLFGAGGMAHGIVAPLERPLERAGEGGIILDNDEGGAGFTHRRRFPS